MKNIAFTVLSKKNHFLLRIFCVLFEFFFVLCFKMYLIKCFCNWIMYSFLFGFVFFFFLFVLFFKMTSSHLLVLLGPITVLCITVHYIFTSQGSTLHDRTVPGTSL